MVRRNSVRTAIAMLVGVAIGGLTTGATFAATHAASAGVKACTNSAGDLALLSKGKCPRGYKAVTISRTGATGKAGPRGAAGPAGPSNGYGLSLSSPKANGTEKLALPAGKYIITWDFQDEEIVDGGPSTGSYASSADCVLYGGDNAHPSRLGSSLYDFAALVPDRPGDYNHLASETQTLSASFTTAASVSVLCPAPPRVTDGTGAAAPADITTAIFFETDITATKVAALGS